MKTLILIISLVIFPAIGFAVDYTIQTTPIQEAWITKIVTNVNLDRVNQKLVPFPNNGAFLKSLLVDSLEPYKEKIKRDDKSIFDLNWDRLTDAQKAQIKAILEAK